MKSIINRIALAVTFAVLFYCPVDAQNPSQTPEKSEATIELSYYKKADMTKTVVAIVKVRKDNKFVPAKNERVNFYVMNGKEQQLIESANTNNKGRAVIVLHKNLPLDEELYFTIVAKFENNSLYENAEEQIHYKDATLTLSLNPHDTAQLVTARVTETGKDGKEIPVKSAEVKFYVQRLFGIMPAAEDNTISMDEKGEASFAFPKIIPGDAAGFITVAARIEDNERFGNVENKAATTWGTVLAIERDPFPRALWEPSAPLPLLITILTIFGGVWCTYFFILFQLRKIKKDEELTINN
jgi:5-hydroxyisourate hydrolase-like protein (transthyretin family)